LDSQENDYRPAVNDPINDPSAAQVGPVKRLSPFENAEEHQADHPK
jgi:hypothetical protein